DWDASSDGDGQYDPGEDGPNNHLAIATDKTPLLPGDVASFANYTSYSHGINGLMIDIANLPAGVTPVASDFRFHTGNDSTPGDWPVAPAPSSVTIAAGVGTGGSDRVTIIWPDGAIRNEWLEVTVEPTPHFPLPTADVFYFGNAVAEAGNIASDARVTTAELLLARNNPRGFLNSVPIDFPYDYNRDRHVNSTDVLLARNNQTNFLNDLELIDLSGNEAAEQGSTSRQTLAGEFAWLYDQQFSPATASTQPRDKKDLDPEVIDQLLAEYWPRTS
ncbi:MAG: hypothetical protein HQ567_05455, partial [Candidatus Nealsonbacteria bacterium]|nr:hypothetical protein [Candidatus Nealsonbacteria bacterium]